MLLKNNLINAAKKNGCRLRLIKNNIKTNFTWGDLASYTWESVATKTWGELGGNTDANND